MDVDLQACVRGDKQAWDAFVERYAPIITAAVHRVLARRTGSVAPGMIDDPVQETFVRLIKDEYRLLRSFDPSRASLVTWLTLVARSTTIDHLRRRRHDPVPLDGSEAAPVAPVPASPGPAIPLQILTGRQRLVLHLLFDREMTVAEAAGAIGVDEQTVRSTKHKALSRLRAHFSDAGIDPGSADEQDEPVPGDAGGGQDV